jgi:hypothetical protein
LSAIWLLRSNTKSNCSGWKKGGGARHCSNTIEIGGGARTSPPSFVVPPGPSTASLVGSLSWLLCPLALLYVRPTAAQLWDLGSAYNTMFGNEESSNNFMCSTSLLGAPVLPLNQTKVCVARCWINKASWWDMGLSWPAEAYHIGGGGFNSNFRSHPRGRPQSP